MLKDYTRLHMMFWGNVILGISIGLFRIVDLGTDPFSSMVIGLSRWTTLSFGNIQCIACILLFGLMFLWKRENIGIGTFPSIFMNGYISDFIYFSLKDSAIDTQILLGKSLLLIFALVICTFSVALCIEANLGTAAYDTLSMIIEDKTKSKISFKMARIYTDSFCVGIGLIFGANIGINTFVMALFTGILVNYFRNRISCFRLNNKEKQSLQHEFVQASNHK